MPKGQLIRYRDPRGQYNREENERQLDQIQEALADIETSPLWDGALLQEVELKSSKTIPVSHGLGREPNGFFVVRIKTPGVSVTESTNTNRAPTQVILLDSTSDVTVDLWIF